MPCLRVANGDLIQEWIMMVLAQFWDTRRELTFQSSLSALFRRSTSKSVMQRLRVCCGTIYGVARFWRTGKDQPLGSVCPLISYTLMVACDCLEL
jgi:hypothetical protein